MIRIQTKDVVATAAIVPVGIAFDASAKSPDRFEPAMMPNKPNWLTVSCMNSSFTNDTNKYYDTISSSFHNKTEMALAILLTNDSRLPQQAVY